MDNPSHHRRYSNRNADIGRYWECGISYAGGVPSNCGNVLGPSTSKWLGR
jgi:hypothetical protein